MGATVSLTAYIRHPSHHHTISITASRCSWAAVVVRACCDYLPSVVIPFVAFNSPSAHEYRDTTTVTMPKESLPPAHARACRADGSVYLWFNVKSSSAVFSKGRSSSSSVYLRAVLMHHSPSISMVSVPSKSQRHRCCGSSLFAG
jgi:hypothetical protein